MALHRIELGERLDQITAEEKSQKDGTEPFAQN
jgi:hypothetical protein